MIVIELLALAAMAIVFVATFVGSARSHTRAQAWATPAADRPSLAVQSAVRPAVGTLIDAQDRFAARRSDEREHAAAA